MRRERRIITHRDYTLSHEDIQRESLFLAHKGKGILLSPSSSEWINEERLHHQISRNTAGEKTAWPWHRVMCLTDSFFLPFPEIIVTRPIHSLAFPVSRREGNTLPKRENEYCLRCFTLLLLRSNTNAFLSFTFTYGLFSFPCSLCWPSTTKSTKHLSLGQQPPKNIPLMSTQKRQILRKGGNWNPTRQQFTSNSHRNLPHSECNAIPSSFDNKVMMMPIPPPPDKTSGRLLYRHRHSSPNVPMTADYANTLSPCPSSSLMSEDDDDDDISQSTQRSLQLPPLHQRLQQQRQEHFSTQQGIIRNRVEGQRF